MKLGKTDLGPMAVGIPLHEIKGGDCWVRWMIRRDMPRVLEIENRCFDNPWTEDDFIRCLLHRNCIGMVAEVGDGTSGFMIYELHKNRLHLLSLAVDPIYQRRGIGSVMLRKLTNKLSRDRRNRIMLEASERNLDAHLFFRKIGFKAISVLKDFYDASKDDAYLMQFKHVQTEEEIGASMGTMGKNHWFQVSDDNPQSQGR